MIKEKIATFISFTFGGEVWLPIILFITFLKSGLPHSILIYLLPLTFFLEFIIPFSGFYLLIKLKKVSDWDVTKRKQRYPLIETAAVSWTIALIFIYFLGNAFLFHVFLTLFVLGALIGFITYFWKISYHAALNTTAVILLNYFFDGKLLWLYLIIPVVCWSRFVLKKHTISQLLAGILLSAAVTFIGLYLF